MGKCCRPMDLYILAMPRDLRPNPGGERAKENGVSKRTQEELDRLVRDRPDLLERVQQGEVSAHRAAVEAGIIRIPTALEVAQKAVAKLTARLLKRGFQLNRDQETARLFNESGWTQERIASKLGKVQRWVSYRLVFGRFLMFRTTCSKDEITTQSLTEGAFRQSRSPCVDGNDPGRVHLADCSAIIENRRLLVQSRPGSSDSRP